MQQVVAQLIFKGAADIAGLQFSRGSTLGSFPLRTFWLNSRRKLIQVHQTHLPLSALVFSPKAKYIYVGRDVRDVVWSLYNHLANFTDQALDGFNAPPDLGPPVERSQGGEAQFYHDFLEEADAAEARGFASESAAPERLLLGAPQQRQVDSAGELDDAQVRRLMAFGDRLHDPWRQEPQPNQSAHRSAIKPLALGQRANRMNPSGEQVLAPSARTRNGLEEREINGAGCGIAIEYQPHLDSAPLQLHRDEFAERDAVRRPTLFFCNRRDRQPE